MPPGMAADQWARGFESISAHAGPVSMKRAKMSVNRWRDFGEQSRDTPVDRKNKEDPAKDTCEFIHHDWVNLKKCCDFSCENKKT